MGSARHTDASESENAIAAHARHVEFSRIYLFGLRGMAIALCLIFPKVLEPRRRQLGITHCVLDVLVAEVGLGY
jgi:hypothetical protein